MGAGQTLKRQEGQREAAGPPGGWGEGLASREDRAGEDRRSGEEKAKGFGGRGEAGKDLQRQREMVHVSSGTGQPGSNMASLLPASATWGNFPNLPTPPFP